MDQFELRRLEAKKQAQQAAERDRKNSVREKNVRFSPAPESCGRSSCTGLLADRGSRLVAVVCHPWGPLGGSMHDITVSKIIDQLGMSAGLSTLRFNFRSGLGRGHGSAADVRGACAFVMQTAAAAEQIVLIGYSYGASVVASIAADIPEVAAFALIAPPLGANPCLFMCRSPITRRACPLL
mgnify:CR=1 FL=1